jgi:hypothetical protein
MRRLLPYLIVGGLAVFAYHRTQKLAPAEAASPGDDLQVERSTPRRDVGDDSRFRCDGRTHCSQMSSCAEATWFLEHCPGTEMDGDRDGIPCEKQYCRR